MGLTVAMSNALSGMSVGQKALEVVSRNVANAGTPGYHRQSLQIQEGLGEASSFARFSDVERAFVQSLQSMYGQETSANGYADVRSSFLQRAEAALGKPGDPNSIDTVFRDFQTSLSALSTSPDDYATRALAVSSAQTLAQTLNGLTTSVQDLRQETENQLENHVAELNSKLKSLEEVNNKLSDYTTDKTARASLLDERDRLVTGISELVDTRVTYKSDGTVALMTKSGLGLLDQNATRFDFEAVGSMSATAQYDVDDTKNGVGRLVAYTPAGLKIDVFDQKVIQSGRIAGLVDIRDKSLVQLQGQIDEVAGSIAQALNTIETSGTAATSGVATGFEVDLANVQKGNEFSFTYTLNGTPKTVRVIRVDDPTKLPMDYTGSNGDRVMGLDFSGGIANVAAALQTAIGPGLQISNPSGTVLQILDDGATGATDVKSLTTRTTVTADQGAGLALSLFVDANGQPFTNNLDGQPQKRGFAGRIAVNPAVLADNTLLVKATSSQSLGDSSRVDYLIKRLETANYGTDKKLMPEQGDYKLSGNVGNLISQMMNYQGNQIQIAKDGLATRKLALEAVETRIGTEYGVNVDDEMGRLLELQTAYAANARVISVVQELLNAVIQI